VLLDKNTYWYHIVKADSPKQAFVNLVEELTCWKDYNGEDIFIPKRFHLLSKPTEKLADCDVAAYVESISDKKVRPGYAVCLFLKSDRYFFYAKKGNT
jgi:hypothetical protein